MAYAVIFVKKVLLESNCEPRLLTAKEEAVIVERDVDEVLEVGDSVKEGLQIFGPRKREGIQDQQSLEVMDQNPHHRGLLHSPFSVLDGHSDHHGKENNVA